MMSFIYSYRFLRFFVEAALSLASYMRSESSNEPHCRMHIANSISLPLQLHITGLRRICVRQLPGYVAQSEQDWAPDGQAARGGGDRTPER